MKSQKVWSTGDHAYLYRHSWQSTKYLLRYVALHWLSDMLNFRVTELHKSPEIQPSCPAQCPVYQRGLFCIKKAEIPAEYEYHFSSTLFQNPCMKHLEINLCVWNKLWENFHGAKKSYRISRFLLWKSFNTTQRVIVKHSTKVSKLQLSDY